MFWLVVWPFNFIFPWRQWTIWHCASLGFTSIGVLAEWHSNLSNVLSRAHERDRLSIMDTRRTDRPRNGDYVYE